MDNGKTMTTRRTLRASSQSFMRSSREKAKSFWPAGGVQFYVGCFNLKGSHWTLKNHPIPVPNDYITTSLLLDRHIAKGAKGTWFFHEFSLYSWAPWHKSLAWGKSGHGASSHLKPSAHSGSKGRRPDKNSKSISLQVRLRKAKPKIDRDFDFAKNDSTIWLNELKEETIENSMQFRSMRWELQHSKIWKPSCLSCV